jgi:hypothetical protein
MWCVLLTGYGRGNARFVPGEGTRKSIHPNVLGASCEMLQGASGGRSLRFYNKKAVRGKK